MNLPRIIIGIWLLAPCSTAFTPHRRGYYDRRASHRLYDTSVSDFWSSVAATAISPNEAFLTTVSLASVSALVGAANAGLAARESQRQSEMKDKLESQQADLGKFQKSVENLNRLAQVLTATGTLSAAYVLLNIVPLIDQSARIPPASPQVLAEKRAAVRSANKPSSTIDDLKLPVNKKFDSIVKDFVPAKSSEQADWIKEKEDKMNALLEKKRDQLLSSDSNQPDSSSVMKSESIVSSSSSSVVVGEMKSPSSEQAKIAEPSKNEVKKEDVNAEVKKEEAKKAEVKADAKKEESKSKENISEVKKDETKADVKKEEGTKKEEVKKEVKKEEAKKEETKADVKKEEPKKDEIKAEVKKDEPKKEEVKADVKKDEPKKEEVKMEVKENVAKKEDTKGDAKKEEPKKEEIKAAAQTQDNLMDRLMNKMDEVKPKEPELIIQPDKGMDETSTKQAEKKDVPVAPKKEEPIAEKKDLPVPEKKEASEQQSVAPLPSRPPQTTPERVSAPMASVEVRKQVADSDGAASTVPFFKNAMKNMDAVFTGIGRTTSTLARQVTKLLPADVAKEIEKVNDKDVGIFTSVAFLATTVGGFVIAASRDDEPDSKKQKSAKPITGENRSLRNNGMNDNNRSPTESSGWFGQRNGMESSSRLPSTDNEKRNGFGSYLEQISRGDSPKAVNGASSRGDSRSVRSQGNPSGWNATGLSDPDSWDPRDFDPLTQSLSGRALSQPSDPASDKRQTVARSAPPAGVSAQSRPNVGPPSPISQSQPSQNRPSPVQRAPPNSRRPQGRDATDQSVMRVNQSDRKPAWTPQSNNAPYTNPSTLMPTDVAQLSQPPLQGEPVQRRQERTQPERPLVAQPDKKATWTPPSNNAPYTNPSTLMPTDVTPVDGDSYLGSLSSSSPSTRPRGSYNPFGRPVVANVRNSPTSETTVSRQRTDTSIAPRTANTQQTPPFGATRNQGPPSARSDARAQSEVVTQITPERVASRGREQADRVVPVRRTESPSAPAVLSRPIEPARAETPPQRPIITPPRPQSPLVPADLIRPVKPDITSVTRATSGRSDTANESRAQPSSMQRSNNANSRFPDTVQNSQPRNGFFPQQSSQATEQRNGQVNGENLSRSRGNVDSREVPLVSSDTSRVDSNVGPDQPRTNRTPWISSGSSNDQSDYNPRNFDPRTQTFRETLGPNSRARQNGQGQ